MMIKSFWQGQQTGQRSARRWLSQIVASVTLLCLPMMAFAVKVGNVEARLVADQNAVVAGEVLRVGLHLRHDREWHTYWRNPGDSGLPTQFNLKHPDGFSAGEIAWPRPSRFLIPPLANLGYDRDVLLMRSVSTPGQLVGQAVRFETTAQWLVCREVCVPGEAKLSLTLPVAEKSAPGADAWLFDDAEKQLPVGPRDAQVARVGDQLHIHVDPDVLGGDAQRVEYFAQNSEQVSHFADQRLVALEGDGAKGFRLEVPLAKAFLESADSADITKAGSGVLVIDDSRAVAINGVQGDAAAFAGLGDTTLIKGHVAPFMEEQQNAASGLLAAIKDRKANAAGGSALATSASGSSAAGAAALVAPAAATQSAVSSIWIAMLFALLGGLILNLMPCVFPVIGLKILGFAGEGLGSESALTNEQRSRVKRGCFWFAAGVVLAFLALAGLLIALRAGGEAVGWGFQLQSPVFVAAMALLFVAIGLNFAGLFEVGTSLTRMGQFDQASSSPTKAALSGALAVLVATPCTAPFMGSALGYTLSLPVPQTLLIYVALGVGMSLPYLLLGLMPQWLRLLPRPGRWMETLRQLLSFPMFVAAAWLVWVFGQQAGIDGVMWVLLAIVSLAFALWLYGRFAQSASASPAWTVVALVLALGSVALAWPGTQLKAPDAAVGADAGWQKWSNQAVAQTLGDGKPVFIDFTASWCASCLVNKKLVLNKDSVITAFNAAGVQRFQADWTNNDPVITAELARNGRNSVPLYLLYFPDGKPPRVLPELLTEAIVLEALQQR
jgi:thiol:disulfide interchange protein DsbD